MIKVALIAPLDSWPTRVTFAFIRRVKCYLEGKLSKDAQIDEFPVLAANRIAWWLSKAFNSGYDLVVYAGHGLPDKLIGQLIYPITIWIPMQDIWLKPKTKIFYAVACLTGRRLGPTLVKYRTRSYVGNIDYTFVAYKKPERNYMEDFIDTWMEFVRALVAGKTAGRAFEAFKDRMRYYIRLYQLNAHRWPYARWYAYTLSRNLNGFRLYGDPDVTLYD